MSKLSLKGNPSGTGNFTIEAPNSNVDRTLALPDEAGTVLTDVSDIESQVKTATNATGSAPVYAARAWVNFDGDNGSVRASGNISSVVRNRVGDYTVFFDTAMPDNDYAVSAIASGFDGSSATWVQIKNDASLITTSVQITTAIQTDGNPRDREIITLAVFR